MAARRTIVALVIVFVSLGCDEAFEPKGPFQEQLVVFAILTSLKDTQFVRLYKTYNPSGFNPLEHTTETSIVGGQVRVSAGSTVYQFRDTTITRVDKSRYSDDIAAYVAHPFALVRGETYTLNIQTDSGDDIAAEVRVPQQAEITVSNSVGFRNPIPFRDDFFALSCRFSSFTYGFVIHAYLEYDIMENGVFVGKREEIPVAARDRIDCTNFRPAYHKLQRRRAVQPDLVTFDVLAYMSVLSRIWTENPLSQIRMRQVVFEVSEFDPALYTYVNLVNGFRDEFSIRTDEPDYTNILGGRGIFGAITQQIVSFTLSDTTGKSLRCDAL
jgi:hypothetical protein